MNKHYVYVYKVNKVIRYVGHGVGQRAYSKSSRSNSVLTLFNEESFEIVFLHSELTKEQSEDLENEYLDKYLNNPKDEWNLINKRPSSKTLGISPEFANKYWYYDESSPSCLRWKIKRRATLANSVAGYKTKLGYYKVSRGKTTYKVHRIIMVLLSNEKIKDYDIVDHIDSNPSNNKSNNLQIITQKENIRKRKRSGKHLGVHWSDKDKSYHAYFQKDKVRRSKYFSVSTYGSKEKALKEALIWRKVQLEAEISATIHSS